MDFNDSPEEAAFRAEVRSWLAANAQEYTKPLPANIDHQEYANRGREWQKKKAAGGYAAISWPRSQGGRDGTAIQEVIFAEEEARYHMPLGPFIGIGTNLAVPTIRTHGTPEQIQQFASPTLHGDILWCQLFSEPAAGSDLAGLRTRAVLDGDDWVVDGQKVWTSWAHTADWGILLARTDPDVPKHKGLTFFLLDMRTPGVEVRPIRQISGESEFNEVFLTNVRIPDSQRLGPVGAGWKVTMTTLMNERGGAGTEDLSVPTAVDLAKLTKAVGPAAAPYRTEAAKLLARELGLKYFRFRLLTAMSRGETPSPIVAMMKLVFANNLQDLTAAGIEIAGLAGSLPGEEDRMASYQHGYLWAAAMRIAGGADEILRNQISERVLGLPPEIRVDKDIPFSKLTEARR